MKSSNFIFGGKRFRYPTDFEQEFKPTKWSIRKYMCFTKNLDIKEFEKFVNHTVFVLNNFYSGDKDTISFINNIKNKTKQYEKKDQCLISSSKDNYNKLIKIMAMLRKQKIIIGTEKNIAEVLKNNMGVKYSLSTITDKLYKFNSELNEKNSNEETFKYFQILLQKI